MWIQDNCYAYMTISEMFDKLSRNIDENKMQWGYSSRGL